MKKTALIFLFMATSVSAQELNPELSVSHVPEIGKQQTVSVGTTLHEYNRTYSFNAAVPQERMKIAPLFIPLIIESGTLMFSVPTKTKFKACIKNGACGIDDDGDGIFDRMAIDSSANAFKMKNKVVYQLKRISKDESDSVRQVIMYSGATGDTLRLSYREFSNNLARPAFTEELTIPITKIFPQDVAVKAVKIRIHSIDGLGVRYEILP